jgi:CheY-like chemotaxis protein
VLAVSADSIDDQLANYVAAGMNGHVSKPIHQANLLDAVDKALNARQDPVFAVAGVRRA